MEINFILFWVFLLLIYIQWKFCWCPLFLDNFRSRLFAIRERLFLHAVNGELSFEDKAYQMLWSRLNCLLRYAHRNTLLDVIVFFPYFKRFSEESEKSQLELERSIKLLGSKEKIDLILNIKEETRKEVGKYFIYSSPTIWFFSFPFLILVYLIFLIRLTLDLIKKGLIYTLKIDLKFEKLKRFFRIVTKWVIDHEIQFVNKQLGGQIECELRATKNQNYFAHV